MRKYYTRPCNFYYGNYAKNLVYKKKAMFLTANNRIAFDKVEIFHRKKKGKIESEYCSINDIKYLKKEKREIVINDLKNITSKRRSIFGMKFQDPVIMGILNITPDSFSDGGLFFEEAKAFNHANLMIKDGATIIDIGGESTRPGSKIINEQEEWSRVKNIIIKLKNNFPKIFLSLDTRKSNIMSKGIDCGIDIINDVSGLNFDKEAFDIINSKKVPFILHHMQGTPDTMQKNPKYEDALLDIFDFFEEKINFCLKKKI